MRSHRIAGFTLIELLVVIGIIGVLLSVGYLVIGKMIERGYMAQEIGAARTLSAAYATAAAENDGILMAGYDDSASSMRIPGGGVVTAAAAHRYPYRLAEYFNYAIDGTILLSKNRKEIAATDIGDKQYAASLYPALGMNISFVGGAYYSGESNSDIDKECATRLSQVTEPSKMLVFASAARKNGDRLVSGFFELDPPNKRVTLWSGGDNVDKDNYSPDRYGNVAFRHNGLAVCAFLDGSVRMMSPEELRDMRYWNKNAQAQNDPNYHVSITGNQSGNKYR